MDGLILLSLLALAMLVCSFIAGSLPLAVTLSEDKLQLVTALGAGLLVGAALAVIIPEGVGAVYSHQIHEHAKEVAPAAKPEAAAAAAEKAEQPAAVHVEPPDHGEWIGAALVLGFVFMLLVDQISQKLSGSTDASSRRNQITATLGLVVHAAADGIALGASATTKHLEMEMIVFFAIMLHKAPTAFGLVTFLLHEGLERTKIRRHLLIFSLSAPVGALVTYLLISQGSSTMLDSTSGLVLLFSGGTFLYVATVHVLPEISHSPHSSNSALPSNLDMSHSGVRLPKSHLLALIVGAICPVFLNFGHSH
ncbi:zinc transporter ZIP9-like [Paramacrobiotus metropolitanus]|uniref:zinc transporter ZIP9-like n=1 Tax=Paramacrobiotus metropolitanus TaxID=2943436 RepID=UPI002445A5E9|nr:zinc transporter ZIP9-like [Paramacrobiotus metropolitanus]